MMGYIHCKFVWIHPNLPVVRTRRMWYSCCHLIHSNRSSMRTRHLNQGQKLLWSSRALTQLGGTPLNPSPRLGYWDARPLNDPLINHIRSSIASRKWRMECTPQQILIYVQGTQRQKCHRTSSCRSTDIFTRDEEILSKRWPGREQLTCQRQGCAHLFLFSHDPVSSCSGWH